MCGCGCECICVYLKNLTFPRTKRLIGYDTDADSLDADRLRHYIFGGHVSDYMRHMQEEDEDNSNAPCRLFRPISSSTPDYTSTSVFSWNYAWQHGLSEHGYTVACGSFYDTLLVLFEWHTFH